LGDGTVENGGVEQTESLPHARKWRSISRETTKIGREKIRYQALTRSAEAREEKYKRRSNAQGEAKTFARYAGTEA